MSTAVDVVHRPRVIVLGSLNVDHLWSVAHLPRPGHTVPVRGARCEFGGKGANQAVAAARQGARVDMLGMIGADADGQRYREHLAGEGIATASLLVEAGAPTGAAHVYVDDAGENMIVVNGGANLRLDPRRVEAALVERLAGADVLLAQFECPVDAVERALQLAHERGVRTLLNAAPYVEGVSWSVPVDTVLVNEHECRAYFRREVRELQELSPEERVAFLRRHRIEHLVATQGGSPTVHFSAGGVTEVPAHRVEPVDTVGAGDTFAGALAVRLAEGEGWREALWSANVAAALSTLSPGAQAAMPTRPQVEEAGRVPATRP